jgi:hypothetical protein
MKYKVGDYVTIRKDLKDGNGLSLYVNPKMLKYAGKTYRVKDTVIGGTRYILDLPCSDHTWHWTDEMLEDAAKPVYRDGDIVQTENGNYYLVWNAEEKYGVRDCGHVYFEEDGAFSVVKVWKPNRKALFTFKHLDRGCGELRWEKKTVKEMTVAEIEEKLGYSIKVVKE